MVTRSLTILAALSLVTTACSSSESGDDTTEAPGGNAEDYLGLSQPDDGFQVRNNGKTIPPGADMEYCEVAELPGDPSEVYYVGRIEFGNAPYSHHLIIDAAPTGSELEGKLLDMSIGETVECIGSQATFGDGFEFVGGVQQPYGELAFPPGIGRIYHGGQRVIFNYHYLNITDEPVEAKSAFNFHLVAEEDVERIAEIFSFNNVTIDTPPGGSASFTGQCEFEDPVIVSSVTRHTHKWGTDFSVWFAGGDRDGENFWVSTDWEHDVDHPFDEPLLMQPGEGFRFECAYQNTADHALRFGPNATDEMCILFGLWWPDAVGSSPGSQDCMITQVGDDGIARPSSGEFAPPTDAEVAACMEAATDQPCAECACGSCGGLIVACNEDPSCAAIFACVQETGCDQTSCGDLCGDVINENSAGVGSLIQLSDCMTASCPLCSG